MKPIPVEYILANQSFSTSIIFLKKFYTPISTSQTFRNEIPN